MLWKKEREEFCDETDKLFEAERRRTDPENFDGRGLWNDVVFGGAGLFDADLPGAGHHL